MARQNTHNPTSTDQNRMTQPTRRSNRSPCPVQPVNLVAQDVPPIEPHEPYDPLWILMPLTEGFLIIYAVVTVIACLNAVGLAVLGILKKLEIESAGTYYCRFVPEHLYDTC